MHRPNNVVLLSSTANPASIRRTFAQNVLSTRPGSPHYHIMQNSALVSSSDLIISFFSCYQHVWTCKITTLYFPKCSSRRYLSAERIPLLEKAQGPAFFPSSSLGSFKQYVKAKEGNGNSIEKAKI